MSNEYESTANGAHNDRSESLTNGETSQTQQTLNNIANGVHLKQKRARSRLSCIPCRQGKLKCNRSHDPACDQCIKRNRETSCLYVAPPVKQKPTQNVKGRIRQLENLVVDLMNQQHDKAQTESVTAGQEKDITERRSSTNRQGRAGPFSQPTPPSENDSVSPNSRPRVASGDGMFDDVDIEAAAKPFGRLRINKDEISYVGDTHWHAILHGISELKRELGDEDDEPENTDVAGLESVTLDAETGMLFGNAFGNVPLNHLQSLGASAEPHVSTGLGFMLGNTNSVTREQLISSVPEKKIADRLLSLWFNSPDPFKPIIHAPTFQDEYRRFWRNPKETPTMWLGLLFAILSLAESFGLRDIDPTADSAKKILADVNKYHTLAASAAVLADFTKPKQYTLECLLLYAAGLRSNEAFVNVWLMIGLIVRLALRMGYHRDPASYPAISVFNGEMRRRLWAIVSMIDVLISFQLGLPSMVKTLQSDCQPPRNLLDRDFNVNSTTLPPSRGIDELTPSSYTRAKLRLVRIFADASELSHATVQPSHEEMMELDRQLEEDRSMVPPLLQMPDISELVTDPAEQLMCRFNLDLLYLKTRIVLHRRYMDRPFSQLTPHEQQAGIGYSRKVCISSALRVLSHHHTIYSASQAGGQLESVKWYMGSISTHDFLLASMVICLELSQQISNNTAFMSSGDHLCPHRAAMMSALEKSQKIWSDASGRKRRLNQFLAGDERTRGEHMFDETEKASRAMAVMLQKVKAKFPEQANALAQLSEDPYTASPPPPVPAEYTGTDLGIAPQAPLPNGQVFHGGPSPSLPFAGVMSFHQWGDMEGVPATLNTNDNATLSNATTSSTSGSNGFSQSLEYQSDFSVIGDMLDGNIDWEMFDTGVTKASQQQQWNNNVQQSDEYSPFADMIPVAGNAIMNGGTGPGSGQAPPLWMDFQDMEDVNFDVGSADQYNSWPLTGQEKIAGRSWINGAVR